MTETGEMLAELAKSFCQHISSPEAKWAFSAMPEGLDMTVSIERRGLRVGIYMPLVDEPEHYTGCRCMHDEYDNGIEPGRSVLDVAREHGLLLTKNQHDRLMGCCPFHEEQTPSFMVDEKVNGFFCFGCRVKGGVDELESLFRAKAEKESEAKSE